jgi:hypothetical protein
MDVHISTTSDEADGILFSDKASQMMRSYDHYLLVSGKPVNAFTASGSAEEGADKDYTLVASPVVIPAGDTSVAITLQVLDDNEIETSEGAILTMGTPTNAGIGSPSVHTVTILDNEPVCPTPDSLPYFGSGSTHNKLIWTLQSPDGLMPVNLIAVTIRWPSALTIRDGYLRSDLLGMPFSPPGGNT